jgi:AraC-like DNA-binding protein
MSSDPGMRSTGDYSHYARPSTSLPLAFELGGGGPERTRVVCCFMGLDERPYNPLLSALPSVIHLNGSGWLSPLLSIAVAESGKVRPGGQNVLARISELMFVEAIRRYVESLAPAETGWLAGLRDAVVGKALGALHGAPSEVWTVERLARHVGVSRSVLAERFTGMVGQPPIQYLALWRMQLASRLLSDGRPIGEVAAAVGYESEAAFSRAFKKLVGQAPAGWRRSHNGGMVPGLSEVTT